MTNDIPNIVPAIGGLVGIGVMAGVANQVVKQVGEQTSTNGKKKKHNPIQISSNYKQTSFSSNMEDRIKRMI